jgi:hypothetical protein
MKVDVGATSLRRRSRFRAQEEASRFFCSHGGARRFKPVTGRLLQGLYRGSRLIADF